MKRAKSYLRLITLLMLVNGLAFSAIPKKEVKQLVCEYKTNPLGIDVAKPRLSWQLISTENDVMQTAYEIRVADSPARLNSGKLIWTTGKVSGSQSVGIVYDGPALLSMQQRMCFAMPSPYNCRGELTAVQECCQCSGWRRT